MLDMILLVKAQNQEDLTRGITNMLEVITRIPRGILEFSSNYPCTHVELHIDLRLGR